MLLAFTILVNSMIALVFKGFERYGIHNLHAIIINYFVCAITASLIFMKPAISPSMVQYKWFVPAILLAVLFIFIFNVVASSVQKLGVLVTTIFQKMSMVFPSIVGILVFNEVFNLSKGLGISLAVIAILLINYPSKKNDGEFTKLKKWWYLAVLTILGSGIIEIGLYMISAYGWSDGSNVEFTASLFFFAGCLGLIFYLIKSIKSPTAFTWKDVLWGVLLGVPNFFSIYWIMVMLERGMDGSVVFPILNVGIIVVNALMGYFLFKEQVSGIRFFGVICALIAIALLVS